ncbi:NAD-dependent epimerase/dehydratase family protein [Bifidobacterium longum]|uniref:NAD-dependent epimerase/dehydratase family protein n=1 Tax=Bifidobacterium longum TaxID=216816 RepID=UPI001E37D40F|nr:NAD(P)-dependent oxidoreductase [Bifidobacterium longum]
MMKVMVTGSDGYIGQGVVAELLNKGCEVTAMGFTPCGIKHKNLKENLGDIFSYDFNSSEIPDMVLHLAWRNGFIHNDLSHLEDLPKHYLFLKAALNAGVNRVAVMGTMHEVGYHEGAVSESTPCNPTTLYGVAKNALRQMTKELCRQHDAQLQWLRGFYLVSNDGRGSSIFAKLVNSEREGKKEFPFTSGRCKYDFLPYDQFCQQVVAAVTQDKVDGVINICSGQPIALGEYIEHFISENGFSIRLAYGKYPDRPYDSPAIWGDSTKIRQILKEVQD